MVLKSIIESWSWSIIDQCSTRRFWDLRLIQARAAGAGWVPYWHRKKNCCWLLGFGGWNVTTLRNSCCLGTWLLAADAAEGGLTSHHNCYLCLLRSKTSCRYSFERSTVTSVGVIVCLISRTSNITDVPTINYYSLIFILSL